MVSAPAPALQKVRQSFRRPDIAVGDRLRQAGVEVVGAADARVGRQRACRQIVRDPV